MWWIVAAAHAAPMEWDWSEPRSFHMVAQHAPWKARRLIINNADARYLALAVELTTTCTATEPVRKAQRVLCVTDDVALEGIAIPKDATKLEPVMAGLMPHLESPAVELDVQPDGYIRRARVIYQDLADADDPRRYITQQLLMQAFSALGPQLPSDGATQWRQKGYSHDLAWGWSRYGVQWDLDPGSAWTAHGSLDSSTVQVAASYLFADGQLERASLASAYTYAGERPDLFRVDLDHEPMSFSGVREVPIGAATRLLQQQGAQ